MSPGEHAARRALAAMEPGKANVTARSEPLTTPGAVAGWYVVIEAPGQEAPAVIGTHYAGPMSSYRVPAGARLVLEAYVLGDRK